MDMNTYRGGGEAKDPKDVLSTPVQIKFLTGSAKRPMYETDGAAGMDLSADLQMPVILDPRARVLIPTGLAFAIPPGFEGQIRPRSGNAWKLGLTVLNTPGTIDSDYRGEVKVILINLSTDPITIEPGMRIAQIVFCPVVRAKLEMVDEFTESTARGAQGFGSSGSGA